MPYLTFSDLLKKDESQSNKKSSFDFIVVGAGSAGCPLASRLSEDPRITVLLVEAGAQDAASLNFETDLNSRLPIGCAKVQHTAMDWQFYAEAQPGVASTCYQTFEGAHPHLTGRSYWPRGKGLGGSSLLNYMAWVRGFASDYNAWEAEFGCSGWNASVVGRVFDQLENTSECQADLLCDKCRSTSTTSGGPYGIAHKKPASPLATRFVQACANLGHSVGDYNCFCSDTPGTEGVVGLHQLTVRQGTRCHAARAYVQPLLHAGKRPNLYVLTGANCQRVILDQLVATGVELVSDADHTKPSLSIHATKEIILSAGALGSPQILLQSGIGPKDSTPNLIHELSQVGQNLQDHLFTGFCFPPAELGMDIGTVNEAKAGRIGTFLEAFARGQGMLTSAGYDISLFLNQTTDKKDAAPTIQISASVATAGKELYEQVLGFDISAFEMPDEALAPDAEGMSILAILLKPKSRGSVTLRSKADKDLPHHKNNNGLVIRANYLTDPDDVKTLVAGLRKCIQIAHSKPYDTVLAAVPFLPQDLVQKYNIDLTTKIPTANEYPDAFLEEFIRRYAATVYHPTSTCRMGTSSSNAVVDARLNVFGVQRLRVADASVMPQIVSANTQASCVVIGEMAARFLQRKYGLKTAPQELFDAVEEYEAWIRSRRRMGFMVLGTTTTIVIAGVLWGTVTVAKALMNRKK